MTPLSGCQSSGDENQIREFEFGRVIDAVEDAGCDPSADDPCGQQIRQAIEDGVRIDFPPGTYRVTEPVEVTDVDRIGFSGTGEATFRPDEKYNDVVFRFDVGELLFKNFDIDIRAPETTTGVEVFASRRLQVENVRYVGRGAHPDPNVTNALSVACTAPDATGVVKNVVAKKGSVWSTYKDGDGRVGIWVGFENEGLIDVEGVDLREFGNNAIYASRTPGAVQVEGGYFLNNNASSIRISGEGSYVDGATIEIDPDKYTGPEADASESYFNGVRIEQGELGPDYKPPGVRILNCDITFRRVGTGAVPIAVWETGRTATIRNTTIEMDDSNRAVHRLPKRAQSGIYQPPDGPRWVRMDNVTVTGTATESSAVTLTDAPKSVLRNCDVSQRGQNRDGVTFVRSERSEIAGGSIAASRFPVSVRSAGGLSPSTCLIRFSEAPTLRAVGRLPAAYSGQLNADPVKIREGDSRCITVESLPKTDGDAPKWVTFTELDGAIASGYVLEQ